VFHIFSLEQHHRVMGLFSPSLLGTEHHTVICLLLVRAVTTVDGCCYRKLRLGKQAVVPSGSGGAMQHH